MFQKFSPYLTLVKLGNGLGDGKAKTVAAVGSAGFICAIKTLEYLLRIEAFGTAKVIGDL